MVSELVTWARASRRWRLNIFCNSPACGWVWKSNSWYFSAHLRVFDIYVGAMEMQLLYYIDYRSSVLNVDHAPITYSDNQTWRTKAQCTRYTAARCESARSLWTSTELHTGAASGSQSWSCRKFKQTNEWMNQQNNRTKGTNDGLPSWGLHSHAN